MESKIKTVFALFIPYAFFCAGLYHLSFWSTFNINIFSFFGLTDIITTYIYPFFLSASVSLLAWIIQYILIQKILPYGGGNDGKKSTKKEAFLILMISLYLISIFAIWLNTDKIYRVFFISIMIMPIISSFVTEILIRNGIIENTRKYIVFIYIAILLPVFSFAFAKLNASEIYKNESVDINTEILPDDTLKFLGKANSHYFFMSLDNKDKYIFDVSEVKGLHLTEYSSIKVETIK